MSTRAVSWLRSNRDWVGRDLLLPWALTRAWLLLVGWLSQRLPWNGRYPVAEAVERGWHFSPHRLVDIWGRWDSGWYLDIVNHGYRWSGDFAQVQGNVAFFPLYPTLVGLLVRLLPPVLRTPGTVVLVGALLSNLLLLVALGVLYRLVLRLGHGPSAARWTVLLLLVYPTSFFCSCFYTESLFLLLAVAALTAAFAGRWGLAGLAGALVALTRPLGVLIAPALALHYLETVGWHWRAVRRDLAWLLLVPAGFLLFFAWVWLVSGDWLAPVRVQAAFGRTFALPWATLLWPSEPPPGPLRLLEQTLLVLVAGLIGASFARLGPTALGAYATLQLLPLLLSGTLQSTARYELAMFPAFMVLGLVAGRRPWLGAVLAGAFFTLMTLLFALWCQLFPIL